MLQSGGNDMIAGAEQTAYGDIQTFRGIGGKCCPLRLIQSEFFGSGISRRKL